MEKFIPYEKLSKKKRRELNSSRRSNWGNINPTTRRAANPEAYDRIKARKWRDDSSITVFFLAAQMKTIDYIMLKPYNIFDKRD